MDGNGKYVLGKQSSMAPESAEVPSTDIELSEEISAPMRMMYLANEGDVEGMRKLIQSGVDVNFKDDDKRTALHVAACAGKLEVVKLLIQRGAEIDVEDKWGSTPRADAIHYKNNDVAELLGTYGAKPPMAPMLVKNLRDVPEYEFDPKELVFIKDGKIDKGTFSKALWRGTEVAVKILREDFFDEDKVRAFRDELTLLQKVRHPNVVQFLGAVTQSTPMMIVTEFLPKGDLRAYLQTKGQLDLHKVVKFALDIARGLNYLHEHKPESIIHRDLKPSNILRDDTGHLKVADFGASKLKMTKTLKEENPNALERQKSTCRYIAPEFIRKEEYDTKVDVFSFGLILYEMMEGSPPFSNKLPLEAAVAYERKERPPFKSSKLYPQVLSELVEDCWQDDPVQRPDFGEVIRRLDAISLGATKNWKAKQPMSCFHKIDALWSSRHKKDDLDPSSHSI